MREDKVLWKDATGMVVTDSQIGRQTDTHREKRREGEEKPLASFHRTIVAHIFIIV